MQDLTATVITLVLVHRCSSRYQSCRNEEYIYTLFFNILTRVVSGSRIRLARHWVPSASAEDTPPVHFLCSSESQAHIRIHVTQKIISWYICVQKLVSSDASCCSDWRQTGACWAGHQLIYCKAASCLPLVDCSMKGNSSCLANVQKFSQVKVQSSSKQQTVFIMSQTSSDECFWLSAF